MSTFVGVRYAVAMHDAEGRVWWPSAPMDPSRRVEFQAKPKIGKLYQKRGDAERERRHWESKARSEVPRSQRPAWTFQVAEIRLTWPEPFE